MFGGNHAPTTNSWQLLHVRMHSMRNNQILDDAQTRSEEYFLQFLAVFSSCVAASATEHWSHSSLRRVGPTNIFVDKERRRHIRPTLKTSDAMAVGVKWLAEKKFQQLTPICRETCPLTNLSSSLLHFVGPANRPVLPARNPALPATACGRHRAKVCGLSGANKRKN